MMAWNVSDGFSASGAIIFVIFTSA
jgi:hypothetical protein